MKPVVIASILACSTLFAATHADACAMRRYKPQAVMVADAHFDKARIAENRGDLRRAIRLYERAMNADGQDTVRVEAALRSASLHAKLGQDDRVESRIVRAIDISGTHAGARIAMGRHLLPDDPMRAAGAFEVALMLGAGDAAANVRAELAVAYARTGRVELARQYLAQARSEGADIKAVVAAERALEAPTPGVAVL